MARGSLTRRIKTSGQDSYVVHNLLYELGTQPLNAWAEARFTRLVNPTASISAASVHCSAMQTPGHVIINLGILGWGDRSTGTWPIIADALIPDVSMFWFYLWTKGIKGLPDSEVWSQTYFLEDWQNIFDLFNSIPLALIGIGRAMYWKCEAMHSKLAGPTVASFASSSIHYLPELLLKKDEAPSLLALQQFPDSVTLPIGTQGTIQSVAPDLK